ncbi:uncharacterized protein LOC128389167 [Panonychus citri]|uniref:uncharacterized protein LOC128389167 n=1 Tax=Panonychus citri TaxID=50023 RepID=UPI0023074149|nr:uncharacterized protein LOC128389167 [Panonychus citri]
MYFKCLILMTISQIISGAIITGKRKSIFSGTELKQFCETIKSDLSTGTKPDEAINQIVKQFEPKLTSDDDGSRLSKFKGILEAFKNIVVLIDQESLKNLSTRKQEAEMNDNNNDNPNDLVDNEDKPVDNNQVDVIDSGDEITLDPEEGGSDNYNEIDNEFNSDEGDYDVCELINYPDYIDLDEIDSDLIGYDYDSYEYEYDFEPFGLRFNLRLSISAD